MVIDFDPAVVSKLKTKNVHRLFGDIADAEIKQLAKLNAASLVISTIPDIEDNLLLLREVKHKNSRARVIVMAWDSSDAKALYKEGADYVVLPHVAGGRQLAHMIKGHGLDGMEELREKDQAFL